MNDSNQWVRTYALYSGAGLQLAVSIGGGAWLGMWLDDRYDWSPWGAFVGVVVGSAAGFYNLIRIVNQATREDTDARTDSEH